MKVVNYSWQSGKIQRYPCRFGSRGRCSRVRALLAQSVEHFHGKEKVVGSIPTEGSAIRLRSVRHGDVAQLVRASGS